MGWEIAIGVVLFGTILFNMLLVTMVGVGWWKFEDNGIFLNIAATENVIQVVGLVAIVLKYLFKKEKNKFFI